MKAVNCDKICRYNVTAKKTIQRMHSKTVYINQHGVQKMFNKPQKSRKKRKMKNRTRAQIENKE